MRMLMLMRLVFAGAGIGVTLVSREYLIGPEFTSLLDLDVANGVTETEEVKQLYAHRNFAGPNDIVVYFVQRLGGYGGLVHGHGAHPSAIVAHWVGTWHLAHEVGHVLGLLHVDTYTWRDGADCPPVPVTALMTGANLGCIVGFPTLTELEINQMRSSPYTFPSVGESFDDSPPVFSFFDWTDPTLWHPLVAPCD